MAVHWNNTPEGTKPGQFKTVKHDRAYCHCPDGFRCGPEWMTPPKKDVKNKRLEKRLRAFDAEKNTPGKGSHFRHRPGSQKR